MKQLPRGKYFGVHKKAVSFRGIILSDIEYNSNVPVPWHYHENAYFAYILKGHLLEVNKKESYQCTQGTFLFHHWQEQHYNTKHSDYSQHFNIEFENAWFKYHHLDPQLFQGSIHLDNPVLKLLLLNIYKEFKIDDTSSQISIEGLILQMFGMMIKTSDKTKATIPNWVGKVKEILHEKYSENPTLDFISNHVGIHPIYLSNQFSKYFHTSFGDYIRKIKIEKSILLLTGSKYSLTEIAYELGFSDQSHFTRCFKAANGITPFEYRKKILGQ